MHACMHTIVQILFVPRAAASALYYKRTRSRCYVAILAVELLTGYQVSSVINNSYIATSQNGRGREVISWDCTNHIAHCCCRKLILICLHSYIQTATVCSRL